MLGTGCPPGYYYLEPVFADAGSKIPVGFLFRGRVQEIMDEEIISFPFHLYSLLLGTPVPFFNTCLPANANVVGDYDIHGPWVSIWSRAAGRFAFRAVRIADGRMEVVRRGG